jgi:Leucine-rich repeat (LRR) protein
VPEGISAVHNLKELLLQGNHFSRTLLAADVGLRPHLRRLNFGDNYFAGALPVSLQRLNSLTLFRVSNNMLTGDFPAWIGNMSRLEYIDFSSNAFTGSLPSSIDDLKSLNHLNFSNKKYSGIKHPNVTGLLHGVLRARRV